MMIQQPLHKVSAMDHLNNYLDITKLEECISQCLQVVEEVKDKNVILFVGKTSSGKTTTINYLMGKKMINIQITTSVDIKGKIYESHKYRIDAETPLEGFKIGQESKSETLIINCIESSGGIGYFCDMPGFQDTRGKEIEIANAYCTYEAMKGCQSARLILLLSFHEIQEGRGGSLRDTLDIASNFFVNIKEHLSNFCIFFTHVSDKTTMDEIFSEILSIFKGTDEKKQKDSFDFLEFVLEQIAEKRARIIRPLQQDQETIDDIYEQIFKTPKIKNIKDKIKPTLSETCISVVTNYAQEARAFINDLSSTKQFGQVSQILDKLYFVKDTLSIYQIDEIYKQSIQNVENDFHQENCDVIKTIIESINQGYVMSTYSLKRFQEVLTWFQQWDCYKGKHFKYTQLSTESFLNQVKKIWIDKIQLIQKNFDEQQFTPYLNILQSLQKLSEIGTSLKDDLKSFLEMMNLIFNDRLIILQKLIEQCFNIDSQFETQFTLSSTELSKIIVALETMKLGQEGLITYLPNESQWYQKGILYLTTNVSHLNDNFVSNLSDAMSSLGTSLEHIENKHYNELKPQTQQNLGILKHQLCLMNILVKNQKLLELIPDLEGLYSKAIHLVLNQIGEIVKQLSKFIQKGEIRSSQSIPLKIFFTELKYLQNLDGTIADKSFNYYLQVKQELSHYFNQMQNKVKSQVNELLFNFYYNSVQGSPRDSNSIQLNQPQFRTSRQKNNTKLGKYMELIGHFDWVDNLFETIIIQITLKKFKKYLTKTLIKLVSILEEEIQENPKTPNWDTIIPICQSISSINDLNLEGQQQKEKYAKMQDILESTITEICEEGIKLSKQVENDKLLDKRDFKNLEEFIKQAKKIQGLPQQDIVKPVKDIERKIISGFFELICKQSEQVNEVKTLEQFKTQDMKEWKNLGNKLNVINEEERYPNLLKQYRSKDIPSMYNQFKEHTLYLWDMLVTEYRKQMSSDIGQAQFIHDQLLKQLKDVLQSHVPKLREDYQQLDYGKELQEKINQILDLFLNKKLYREASRNLDAFGQIQENNKQYKEIIEEMESYYSSILTQFRRLMQPLERTELSQDSQVQITKLLGEITVINQHLNGKLSLQKINENYFLKDFKEWFNNIQEKTLKILEAGKLTEFDQKYGQLYFIVSSLKETQLVNQQWIDLQLNFCTRCENIVKNSEAPHYDWDENKIYGFNQYLDQLKSLTTSKETTMQFIYEEKYQKQHQIIEALFQLFQEKSNQIINSSDSEQIQMKQLENNLKKFEFWQQKLFSNHLQNQNHPEVLEDLKMDLKKREQNLVSDQLQFLDRNDLEDVKKFNTSMRENKNYHKQLYKQLSEKLFEMFDESCTQLNSLVISNKNESIEQFILRLCNLCQLNQFPEFLKKAQEPLIKVLKDILAELKNFNQKLQTKSQFEEKDANTFSQIARILQILDTSELNGLQKCKIQIQEIQQQKIKFNGELYTQINSASKQYDIDMQKRDLVKCINTIDALKKTDPFIKFIQDPKNIENHGFDKCLIELIKNRQFENYEGSTVKINSLIVGTNDFMKLYWKSKDLCQFTKVYQCGYQMSKLNPSYKQQQEEWKSQFTNEITDLKENIVKNLNSGEFSKKLSENYEFMEQLSNSGEVNNLDLKPLIVDCWKEIQERIRTILKDKKEEFRQAKYLAQYAECLIDIRQISDGIPPLKNQVQDVINDCMNCFVKTKNDQYQISELWAHFIQLDNPLADLIIEQTNHFKSLTIQDLQDKTIAQHNPEYVLKHLQITKDGKSQTLEKEQFDALSLKYKQFTEENGRLLRIYLLQKFSDPKTDLIKKIHDHVKQRKHLIVLKSWNDESKKYCNELLAKICSLWTLCQYKDDPANEKKKLITPHATQIFSVMVLLGFYTTDSLLEKFKNKFGSVKKFENQLAQVKTGEGKSIVLGLLATLLALYGKSVDVVSYSKYLSERDATSFEELFKLLNIQDKIQYGTFSDLSEKLINKEGDIRQMTKNLINGVSNTSLEKSNSNEEHVLLIDEVDVFFSSNFYGKTYNPVTLFITPEIETIMQIIWDNKKTSESSILQKASASPQFTTLLANYPQFSDLFKMHIRSMAQAVIQIYENKHEVHSVKDGIIGYKVEDSISFTTIHGYLTTFSYFKKYDDKDGINEQQKKDKTGILMECGNFSYAETPYQYTNILGVSGTLESLHQSNKNIISNYFQLRTQIPSMFAESKLKFDQKEGVFVELNEDEFFLKIKDESIKVSKNGRSVLVFFKDSSTLNKFYNSKHLPLKKDEIIIIDQKTEKNLDNFISKATRKSQIALIDRAFGRGTDFKCSKEIDDLGGVLVIQAFLSLDYSEEVQIKGRTARQSRNGQYQLILNSDDLIEELHITKQEIDTQKKTISTMYDFLDAKRNVTWGNQIQLLSTSIAQATSRHKLTIEYKQHLINNQREKVISSLFQLNVNSFSQSKKVDNQHFIFCLDDSSSMKAKDDNISSRWDKVIEAVKTFIQYRQEVTDGTDIVSVIYYSNTSRIITKYQPLQNIMNELSKNTPLYGGTKYSVAIDDVFKLIDGESSQHKLFKKAILFLSDGEDGAPEQLPASLNKLKSAFISQISMFWTIGFGSEANGGSLKQMADIMKECGGECKTAITSQDLQQQFTNIACFEQQTLK